jgi:CubicO group peptidase (beta-lactamase class C family)
LIGAAGVTTGLAIALLRKPARPPESHTWGPDGRPSKPEPADAVIRDAVARRQLPGAALAIGRDTQLVELAAFGRVDWKESDPAVVADSTIYDLASMTKAMATATAVWLLVQDGKIHLDDPVQKRLPAFRGRWKERVTWRHLLTHTSGLPPSAKVKGKTAAARIASVLRTSLTTPPGDHVEYSDAGFIVLYSAAEKVAREPLPRFLKRRVWKPLGMTSTSYWPGTKCLRCAPTATRRNGDPYRGEPSDPIAHEIGVATGNAGLFSTAHDVARFASMIANGGELNGVRIFRPGTIDSLATQKPGTGHRTLGWEAFCPNERLGEQQACQHPVAFGHTGWTGTSFWIDPVQHAWVVILSNRTLDVANPKSIDDLRAAAFEGATAMMTSAQTGNSLPTTRAHEPLLMTPPRQ